MIEGSSVVIVGGTRGTGLELARVVIAQGGRVVLTGRDEAYAREVARSLGPRAQGLGIDLAEPRRVENVFAALDHVDHLVLAGIERDRNTIAEYDIDRAVRLTTLKLVGYNAAIHTLLPKMTKSVSSSITLFGGLAKERPYPGSTTVSTVNAGLQGLMHTLVLEVAPIRVNTVHPGIIGDSPAWVTNRKLIEDVERLTPTHYLATMRDVVDAVLFLMDNPAINATDLFVDGGMRVQPLT